MNKNGRIYSEKSMRSAIKDYLDRQKIKKRRKKIENILNNIKNDS